MVRPALRQGLQRGEQAHHEPENNIDSQAHAAQARLVLSVSEGSIKQSPPKLGGDCFLPARLTLRLKQK